MLMPNNAIEIGIPIATIFVSGLAAYFGAFIKTKAANDANNQNFEKVLEQMKTQTAEIENIKAKISDEIWDRQKQWELKRDGVLDVVRTLADLKVAIMDTCVACSEFSGNPTFDDAVINKRIDALNDASKRFAQCSSSYQRAHTVADVVIGGELSTNMSEYFQFALTFAGRMRSVSDSDRPALLKELAKRHNAVILSAREALGKTDTGDFPAVNYDNEISDN
jgi:hypothetical protein